MTFEESIAQDRAESIARMQRRRGSISFSLALMPVFLIVWMTAAFETQDGPAHLYNAHVLAKSLGKNSPFAGYFAIRWSPLPNWLGHLMGVALAATQPFIGASRLTTTFPLVFFAGSIFWLKRQVWGCRGDVAGALFSALLSINVCWLFGFTSFLLGACLFPLTLGFWWSRRDAFGARQAAILSLLVILGYFAHIVSLGLTVFGLVVLALTTPSPRWRNRMIWTCAGLWPLAVFLPLYRGLMREGGPLSPNWGHVKSIRDQIGWVDPISLGSKRAFPLFAGESNWLGFLTPPLLFSVAVILFAISSGWLRRDRERRGWTILAVSLIVGGFCSPDTLGETHGNYLPQRIVLLGLVALAGTLDFSLSKPLAKIALGWLAAALIVQSLTVLDYARESSDRLGPFVRTRSRIGRNQRIGTLLIGIKGRFRSNPLLHADNWLGLGTGNIVWSDYETRHYYFPVQFRSDVRHPPSQTFEDVALLEDLPRKAERWARLLEKHHQEIDLLVVWGDDPKLSEINARWFDPEPIHRDGPLRVFRHR